MPDSHLRIDLGLYFRPISLQLEVGPEPHPKDADGSVTPAEGPWKGIATSPSTEPQTFALVKIDLDSCNPLVLDNRLLHSLYIQAAGYKHRDIIGERGNPCRKRASKRDTVQGRICPPIPKPTEQGLQSWDIEKRRQGQPCRIERSIANTLERLPFTCTTAWGLWYIMLIHLQNSDLNPAVSKTVAKNRWSTLSKALD